MAYRIAGKRKVLIPKSALLALLEPARPEDPTLSAPDIKDPDDSQDSNHGLDAR